MRTLGHRPAYRGDMPNVDTRPDDDAWVPMPEALAWQRDVVLAAGSPVAAQILQAVLDDAAQGGGLAGDLTMTVRFGSFPGLRVMAAVHRLALERQAARVAMCLPTLGGTAPVTPRERAQFRSDVVSALSADLQVLRASLAHTPQTNDPGRAALLRCALSRLDPAMPVRLREIGASAGLNLRADALPGRTDLEAGPLPMIVDRLGCDLSPVDPATSEGRTLLSSYIWVDDVERFRRLGEALRVAERIPAPVVEMDAVDFCSRIASEEGVVKVLWHSAMWAYLPESTRAGIRREVKRIGSTATATAPFVHVAWEWDTDLPGPVPFGLVVTRWDGSDSDGQPRLLATGGSHGNDIRLM